MAGPSSRELALLPKAHLHLHVEAGMSPALLAELSAKYDREVPVISGFGSFAVFASTYEAATDVLRERADWERLADELLAEHVAEGAVYLELIFDAIHYGDRFGGEAAMWDLLLEVFDEASARHGLPIGWMFGIDRPARSHQGGIDLAHLAVSLRDRGVVSFGLHNQEEGHPPSDFADALRIAREGGLQVTPHVGELDGGERVAEALEVLAPDRILHGVRAVEVDGLPERLAAAGVVLDVCPTSNVLLSVVSSYETHPLRRLLDAGVRCTLNADDPLLFGPTLLGEYENARTRMGLSDAELAGIARTSIECAVLPDASRAAALAGVDAWLAT